MNKYSIKQVTQLAFMLGWQDVRQAYRRSPIGPWWITLGLAIQIITMSFVFSLLFKITLREYMPFLATNLILWTFFSATIIEACNSLVTSENIIKQIKLPTITYVLRTIWKNIVILGHNVIVLPIVFLAFSSSNFSAMTFLSLPGLLIMVANVTWVGTFLALLCARYRDMGPIVSSLLMMIYFVTPIMWLPKTLGDGTLAHILLGFNPVYHLLQIVRQPILGSLPTIENWTIAIAMALVGWTALIMSISKLNGRIAFWL